MKIHHELDPSPLRAAAYMAIPDQLDALMKGFAALHARGITLPAETVAWVEHCQAVKARFKK
jgi:hypothetical protein